MWIVRGIIILIGAVALIWLGTLNAGTKVTFHLFDRTFYAVELNVILVMSFLAGMLVWAVGAWIREAQLVLAVARERKRNRGLQDEIDALRTLPLEEDESAASHEGTERPEIR